MPNAAARASGVECSSSGHCPQSKFGLATPATEVGPSSPFSLAGGSGSSCIF